MRKIIFTSHAEFWQVCYDGAPCPCRPFQESHSLCQEYVPNTHNRREGEIVDADLSCSFRLRKASLIRLLSGAGSHEPLVPKCIVACLARPNARTAEAFGTIVQRASPRRDKTRGSTKCNQQSGRKCGDFALRLHVEVFGQDTAQAWPLNIQKKP